MLLKQANAGAVLQEKPSDPLSSQHPEELFRDACFLRQKA
jgi:hypothetical protein